VYRRYNGSYGEFIPVKYRHGVNSNTQEAAVLAIFPSLYVRDSLIWEIAPLAASLFLLGLSLKAPAQCTKTLVDGTLADSRGLGHSAPQPYNIKSRSVHALTDSL
jgi:hypothetical protein